MLMCRFRDTSPFHKNKAPPIKFVLVYFKIYLLFVEFQSYKKRSHITGSFESFVIFKCS